MYRILFAIYLFLFSLSTQALTAPEQRMLAKATPYFAGLTAAIDTVWPDLPMRSFVAAQIEQESLWNPQAELCVPKPSCHRERGMGFGQLTITSKFNAFEEVKRMHPKLRDWPYTERFDPERQLLAVVVKDRAHFRQCLPLMYNWYGALACTASSYNGGFGGFTADRKLCSNTKGCDPTRWQGNIEVTSLKAKTAVSGYGKSFYQINREYVVLLLQTRSPKYRAILGS